MAYMERLGLILGMDWSLQKAISRTALSERSSRSPRSGHRRLLRGITSGPVEPVERCPNESQSLNTHVRKPRKTSNDPWQVPGCEGNYACST